MILEPSITKKYDLYFTTIPIMKITNLIILSLIFLGSISCQTAINDMERDISFLNSKIHLSTLAEAQNLLGTSDEFSKSQGKFDFASKTQNIDASGESDYLTYASEQAQDWTAKQLEKTIKVVAEAEQKIRALNLKFDLPEVINLVKSTCKEEGGAAGYTRQSYIVVQENPDLHLFLHELFHIISRHNESLRTELYKTIEFQACDRITLTDKLKEIKITNPDAPFFEHFVEVNIENELRKVVILTLSNKEYNGGSFFNYLDLKLLELDENNNPLLDNGEAVLYDFESATDMLDKIGKNTSYNIHPEEVMAEHFTYLVLESDVQEPKYIEEMFEVFIN